jgi:hypothetical protein
MVKHNRTTKRRNRRTRRNIKAHGGVGSSSAGVHIFGDMDNQHTVVGYGNSIATNSSDTYMANADQYNDKMVIDGVVGGTKKRHGGNSIITEIAVPAVLLYANNIIGKNKRLKKQKKKTKRVRFSRRIKR